MGLRERMVNHRRKKMKEEEKMFGEKQLVEYGQTSLREERGAPLQGEGTEPSIT